MNIKFLRKKKHLLLLASLFLGAWAPSWAQSVVQIGTENLTQANALLSPIYRLSAASTVAGARSNILYTASELNSAGINAGAVITAISFNKLNTATFVAPASFKVLMANSATVPPLSTATTCTSILNSYFQVYNNTNFTMPGSAGWVTIPLDVPFVNTGDALEIATDVAMTGGTAGRRRQFFVGIF
jgi:hypothetical protein